MFRQKQTFGIEFWQQNRITFSLRRRREKLLALQLVGRVEMKTTLIANYTLFTFYNNTNTKILADFY